ncbi:hypothetical protein SAMN05216371_0528 [Streptomyces sp. TLI_053]|uniref:hypothetical protein n=1 Tax=Streptomyces sp. TLI_053 TaxID=1855352 RepID=UPI00087D42B9|nr:hypothetical protein [Streptomyces sp. TLI_053]SDS74476.1 hypothetical protein SAMN05216371_0528 [Streptomyces sp. TLI_053]
MSTTDLIVPIQLHALVYNNGVRNEASFRWRPEFTAMLNDRAVAEPLPPDVTSEEWDERGVCLQWQLPEVLATGHYDPATGDTRFPLIPNRWLIVRHHRNGEGDALGAAGWVVSSDYILDEHDWRPAPGDQFSEYIDPRSTTSPRRTKIGRADRLSAETVWKDPSEGRPPHLTAIGPGLPAFAAFEPYHRNVLSFFDNLSDLDSLGLAEERPWNRNVFSYLAVGWYAEPETDVLRTAKDIAELLPPDASGPDDVVRALGWSLPPNTSATADTRTRYLGTALRVPWERAGAAPDSPRPNLNDVTVAVGHSTMDAAHALIAAQTRSDSKADRGTALRAADLTSALYHGLIERFDDADGPADLDEALRRTWFAGRDAGCAWEVTDRPTDGPTAPLRHHRAEEPGWLGTLNSDQAAYDRLAPRLRAAQQRYWFLHWLVGLLGQDTGAKDRQFVDAARAQLKELAAEIDRLKGETAARLAKVPHADGPEDLDRAIADFAARKGLPAGLQLRRVASPSFYQPSDPVVLLQGAGARQPLGRDPDQPLPCRFPGQLVKSVTSVGLEYTGAGAPTLPPLGGDVPAVCKDLLHEFAVLDQAARAKGVGGSGLYDILNNPDTQLHGPTATSTAALAAYTSLWTQPWLPLFLQWELHYTPTPYRSGQRTHWTFDGADYTWNGTGALATDEDQARRLTFTGRSFLTPTLGHTLRAQARRYGRTYRLLRTQERDSLGTLDVRLAYLDVLSQTLDGFNDWLLRQDGAARRTPEFETAGGTVPRVGDRESSSTTFQPVRAGQFFFADLRLIDRFGRSVDILSDTGDRIKQFAPRRADSVTPSKHLFADVQGAQRFVQLPPRLLQSARLRLEAVDATTGTRYAAGPATACLPEPDRPTPRTGKDPAGPLAGWLLLNYLDRSLQVHAPDGAPLGELRAVTGTSGTRETAWNPLPESLAGHPQDPSFLAGDPQLRNFVRALLEQPADDLDTLLTCIDTALTRIAPVDLPLAPAQLNGRPLALLRADVTIDLNGPPLSDPGLDTILDPPTEDYPSYTWPVRLGAADRLSDGLIGYYATHGAAGDAISYRTIRTDFPVKDRTYTVPIGNGDHLALPSRPLTQPPVTHHLTLLVDPHAPVHAHTGILPSEALQLPTDLVRQALERIRASFRLTPLLAPLRSSPVPPSAKDTDPVDGIVVPQPAALHGTWTWAEPALADGATTPTWTSVPVAPADTRLHPDDPVPTARAGYLQLHPGTPGGQVRRRRGTS